MTKSFSTEDGDAVVGPWTFWAAMAEVKAVEMYLEELVVEIKNIKNRPSGQRATWRMI